MTYLCLSCDRDAGHRYACDRCVQNMRLWLRELEDYAAIMLGMLGSIGSKGHGSLGVSFGSKPPMSLTPVAMLDPRSADPILDEEPAALHPDTVTAVIVRDDLRCTWISGLPVGGGYAYMAGEYEADRRCEAAATGVGYIANHEENDHANLRALCGPHRARGVRLPDGPDPTGTDIHDHVRSLPSSIHGIACWIREEREQSEPSTWTLVSELRYLRAEISACALEQWVNELHDELKELHHHARSLAKDSPPGPLGHCLTLDCKGTVYPTAIKDSEGKHDGGRCDACQRPYSGPDLVRLGVSEEMAG